jgi:hypothetical protein
MYRSNVPTGASGGNLPRGRYVLAFPEKNLLWNNYALSVPEKFSPRTYLPRMWHRKFPRGTGEKPGLEVLRYPGEVYSRHKKKSGKRCGVADSGSQCTGKSGWVV